MVLMDLNQVMIATLMASLGNHQNAPIDENMLRHMIVNSIRANNHKFKGEFGELVICADDKNYWRKDTFPYYKANRKTAREESEIDWNTVFKILNTIREELKVYLPYKVIQIEKAEADDIIATIVHKEGTPLNTGEPILILSGDKDYIQLHTYGNVKQYSPTQKKYISHSDPEGYKKEHILRGDRGDGIPNVLSQDDTFMLNIRQKQLRQTKIDKWDSGEAMDENTLRNFKRNELLIDLTKVPEKIKEQILEAHEADNPKDRSKLMGYFMKNRMRHLMEHLSEF